MKERAIKKVQSEIQKDIDFIRTLCSKAGLGELFALISHLHFSRIIPLTQNIKASDLPRIRIEINQLDEAYKYLIQCIYKYGIQESLQAEKDPIINPKLIELLIGAALHLNFNYELKSFLSQAKEVEVYGERDQDINVNLKELQSDEVLIKYLYYGARLDKESQRKKSDLKTIDNYVNSFKQQNEPYKDLIEKEFGISLDRVIYLVLYIKDKIDENISENNSKFITHPNGNIDINAYQSILGFGLSLIIKNKILVRDLGEEILVIMNRLSFKIEEFDEYQLQFHLLNRQPILKLGEDFLISPELLLDSLFINSHFSLLESEGLKEIYKKRYSQYFVDQLVEIGKKAGYKEFKRELELYEGKNEIGDIDLVLLNEANNHFILIEAKNHSLPMDVYFQNFEATKERLIYLQNKWEKKVNRRFKHLSSNFLKYDLNNNFTYIIVSRFPEILSHFSNYLVLSKYEFERWVCEYKHVNKFDSLLELIYQFKDTAFNKEQKDNIFKNLMMNVKFE